MATPRIDWIAIYTDFEADSGVPISLSPGNAINEVSSVIHTTEVNGDDRIKLGVPRSSASWNAGGLQERRVLRLEMDDGTVEEYRITVLKEIRARDGKLVGLIEAEGAILELTGPKKIQRDESSGLTQPDFSILNFTPTEIINTYILPFAPSYFALGTIDVTDEVPEFTFDFWSPLEALRQLANLTDTELEITRPGGSAYNINLRTSVGSGSAVPYVALKKNLVSLEKKTDTKTTANRIYGKGGSEPGNRLTLGSQLWPVTANSPLTVSGSPVWVDDAVNLLYVGNEDGTGLQQVTDSTAAGVLTVATPGSFTVGQRIRFFQNSSGDHITYLEDTTSVTANGPMPGILDAQDLVSADNVAPNPKLDAYSGGLPDNWTAVSGATLTEETSANFTRIGASSLKVVAAASGEGVTSDTVSVTPPGDNPYFSAMISVWVVSGAVRLELEHSTEGIFPPPEKKAWTQATGQWVDLFVEGKLLPTGTIKLNVIADGAAATFYLDGALMTNFASAPSFVAEHTSNELWRRSAVELTERKDPDVTYAVDLIDVNAIDPDTYPLDELVLGGNVRVATPTLIGDVELRVIAIQRDKLRGHSTKATLAKRGRLLTDTSVTRVKRQPPIPPENVSAHFSWVDRWLTANGDFHLKYQLDSFGKSIRYTTSNSAQPTRATVEASGTIRDSQSETDLVVAALLAPNPNDIAFISIVAYTGASAAGRAGAFLELKFQQTDPATFMADGTIVASKLTDSVLGFNTDVVFSATDFDTVAWTAGTLKVADGTTYSIASGDTDAGGAMTVPTWIYFDKDQSTTVLQEATVFGDAVTENGIILCYADVAPTATQDAMFIPAIGVLGLNAANLGAESVYTAAIQPLAVDTAQLSALAVTAAKIAANTITAGQISANTITAAEMNVASLSAISADLGTITAGTITVGSMSITGATERILFGLATAPLVGKGIFMGLDVADYEFRVGDPPSGSYLHWNGSTLTLAGTITATSLVLTGDLEVNGDIHLDFASDLILDLTGRLLFDDAGGHTYIGETSNDTLGFVVGGLTMLQMIESTQDALLLGVGVDLELRADTRLYFDNGVHTYITEEQSDQLDFVVGGATMLRLTEAAIDIVDVFGRLTVNDNVGFGLAADGAIRLICLENGSGSQIAFFRHGHASNPLGMNISYQNDNPDDAVHSFLKVDDSLVLRGEWRSDGDVWTVDSGILTSDVQQKENIVPTTSKLADVLALEVINFNWTDEFHNKGSENQTRKRIGFKAQQVSGIFPALVGEVDVKVQSPEDRNAGLTHVPRMIKTLKASAIGAPILVKAFQEYVAQTDTSIAQIMADRLTDVARLDDHETRITDLGG